MFALKMVERGRSAVYTQEIGRIGFFESVGVK